MRGLAFTSSTSRTSGSGASLLGTGVRSLVDVTRLKLGLLPRGFRGLERSGRFTTPAVFGVLEKNECIDFWLTEEELDFFKVAGVGALGVDGFLAMTDDRRLVKRSDVHRLTSNRKR